MLLINIFVKMEMAGSITVQNFLPNRTEFFDAFRVGQPPANRNNVLFAVEDVGFIYVCNQIHDKCRVVFKTGIFCSFQNRNYDLGRLVNRSRGFSVMTGGATSTE